MSEPTLSQFGLSVLNSFNGSYTTILPDSNLGAEKTVTLMDDTGFPVTVQTSQGSFIISPGSPYRDLVFTQNPPWTSITEYLTSFFSTTNKATVVGTVPVGGNPAEGYSVALSSNGSVLAFGGPAYDNATFSGAEWIFTRNGAGNWVQTAAFSPVAGTGFTTLNGFSATTDYSIGASSSISSAGNMLVVGVPVGITNGAFISLKLTGSTWSQVGTYFNPTYTPSGQFNNFGVSISISGDGNTVAIGATTSGLTNGYGAVAIYTYNGTTWTQIQIISPNSSLATTVGVATIISGSSGTSPAFGQGVAISSNGLFMAVGSPGDSNNVGAIFTFTRTSQTSIFTLQTKLVGSPSSSTQQQGYSVALSADGTTLASGGIAQGTGQGNIYLFRYINQTWTAYGANPLNNGVTATNLGYSVALSADGNTLLVGAPLTSSDQGTALTFTRDFNGTWTQQSTLQTISTSYTYQGLSVALSGDGSISAIGAPGTSAVSSHPLVGGVLIYV